MTAYTALIRSLVRLALVISIPFIADNTRTSLAIIAAMAVIYLWRDTE